MKKIIILFAASVLFLNTQAINAQAIIIDHNHAKLETLNSEKIKRVMEHLKIAYQHTSHGSQLVSGMRALAKYNTAFEFKYSPKGMQRNIFFNDYAMPLADDLGHKGDLNWAKATLDLFNNKSNDRNVIMWSWCGGVSDNNANGINAYLNKMAELEKQFPNTYFVYMTGHLDGTGSLGNLNLMNEIIRKFCNDNNKILFDFADIESYSPNTDVNLCDLNADDECNIDFNKDGKKDGNWAETWMQNNPNSELAKLAKQCTECAHSVNLNCALKGIATWNLFSAIVDRMLASSVEDSSATQADPIVIFPNPADKLLNIKIIGKARSTIQIDVFDITGQKVSTLASNFILSQNEETLQFNISELPVGAYEVRIKIDNNYYNKKLAKS